MRISTVSDLVEGSESSVTNVLREHMDAGLPWWRIVADDGAPVFGSEFVGRALERYLMESTPIVPSSSEFGFAVNVEVASPNAAAVAGLESSLSAPASATSAPVAAEDSDDRIENAPTWVGAPVSARAASAPSAADDRATDAGSDAAADDAAEASADDPQTPQASGFAFDALLRGEQSGEQPRQS